MNTFTLFGTQACHLCELAQEMIIAVTSEPDEFQIVTVDIADAEELFERYGIRIPVLQHMDRRELDWPFTPQELKMFLYS